MTYYYIIVYKSILLFFLFYWFCVPLLHEIGHNLILAYFTPPRVSLLFGKEKAFN